MVRFGIARRSQQERLAAGRRALAQKRAARRTMAEARARDLGFSSLREYLIDRHHHRRWRQTDIGHELGLTAAGAVRKLLDAERVERLRASAPAGADVATYGVSRLAAAREALAVRRREQEDEVAARLGVSSLDTWYACGLAAGMTHVALARKAGVSEKWLRLTRRRVTTVLRGPRRPGDHVGQPPPKQAVPFGSTGVCIVEACLLVPRPQPALADAVSNEPSARPPGARTVV